MGFSPLALVAVLLAFLGAGLALFGARAARTGATPRLVEATVTDLVPVEVEMVTGARGTRRVVSLVDVTLRYDSAGTPRTTTLRRAPELAERDFQRGTAHTLFIDDEGRASIEAPSSTFGVVLIAGGLVLGLIGLLLFLLRKSFA